MMTIQSDSQLIVWLKGSAHAAGIGMILVGVLVLVGWIFDLDALKSVFPGLATMKPNTALSFVMAGASLWLLDGEPPPARRRLIQAGGAFVAGLALLTLSQDLFGWNLGLDQLLFQDTPAAGSTAPPGRMSPVTAFNFVLVGSALLLLETKHRSGWKIAQLLALLAGLIALLALVGYAYNIQSLYHFTPFSSMALHTALTFFSLALAILGARPDRGIMAPLMHEAVGGLVVRRLLPAAVILPLALGWLRLLGERMGLYETGMGTALFTLALVIIFAGLIWQNAGLLYRTETEQKRIEAALRLSEERFAQAFRASPDILVISRQADGHILEVNDNWMVLTGYSLNETIGRTMAELDLYINPADHRRVRDHLREHGSIRDFEFEIRCKSGEVRQVSLSAEAIMIDNEKCWLTITRDISERKRAEKSIQLKDELLRMTGEMARVGGWEFETETLKGTWTDEVARIHDLDPGQETNVELGLSFYIAESRQRIEQAVKEAIELAKPYDLELEMVSAKGQHKWIRTMALPILDGDKVVKVRGIFQEITERKQAENRLRQTATELARSNAELEQFAYIASHDLQEPLRAVAGTVQLLQHHYGDRLDTRANEFIQHAVEGATRMQTLIDDLLTLSRVGTRSQPVQSTNCAAVLTTVLANLTLTIAESGAVITHDPLPTVMADATQLSQLFQNLIGNAIKFRRDDTPVIHIQVEQKDNETLFAVCDNGIGIEAQYLERVFGVFQRLHTRREYPGTGIGLAICKKIIERHGGCIWVESELGQGSTFYFTLPDGR